MGPSSQGAVGFQAAGTAVVNKGRARVPGEGEQGLWRAEIRLILTCLFQLDPSPWKDHAGGPAPSLKIGLEGAIEGNQVWSSLRNQMVWHHPKNTPRRFSSHLERKNPKFREDYCPDNRGSLRWAADVSWPSLMSQMGKPRR